MDATGTGNCVTSGTEPHPLGCFLIQRLYNPQAAFGTEAPVVVSCVLKTESVLIVRLTCNRPAWCPNIANCATATLLKKLGILTARHADA